MLAARADLVRAAGMRTVVPSFAALAQVQDKISAAGALAAAGLPGQHRGADPAGR